MKIIGINGMTYDKETGAPIGSAGAGKDTAAQFLADQHGYVIVALADELKRTAMRWYGFTPEQLWGPSELRGTASPMYPQLICRDVLQKLGTEVGREIYLGTWVEMIITTAKTLIEGNLAGWPAYAPAFGLVWNYGEPALQPLEPWFQARRVGRTGGVVIPDVRFRNELTAIRAADGYLVRVRREMPGLAGEAGNHKSETEQLEIPDEEFDALLNNVGTISQLGTQIEQVVERVRERERRRIYKDLVPKKRAADPVLGAGQVQGKGIQPFDPRQENVPPFKRGTAAPRDARPNQEELPDDADMDALFPKTKS